MPVAATTPSPARAAWRTPVAWTCAYVAVSCLLYAALQRGDGLLDWDTYGRLQFISVYPGDDAADVHLLYHYTMRGLMALGASPMASVVAITAMSASAYICLVTWIALDRGLRGGPLALVLVAATIGSPGLVSLFLLREDNVPYLPIVLLLYYLVARDEPRAWSVRRGLALGALVGGGMLLNISLVVLLLALAPAVVLWPSQPRRAQRALIAIVAALAVYYAVAAALGARQLALHTFLPEAVRMRDLTSDMPLVSRIRLEQYLIGLRAIAVDPAVHLMRMSPGLRFVVVGVLPKLLAVLYLAILGEAIVRGGESLWHAVRARLDLVAIAAAAWLFPYLYEPWLVERWDIMWLGAVLVLIVHLAGRPSRVSVALITAAIAVQSVGGLITLAHHHGVAFANPQLAPMHQLARDLVAHGNDPVVLPFKIDRLLLADLTVRAPGRRIYLVRDQGPSVVCLYVIYLEEHDYPLPALQREIRAGRAYLSPALSAHSIAALTAEPSQPPGDTERRNE